MRLSQPLFPFICLHKSLLRGCASPRPPPPPPLPPTKSFATPVLSAPPSPPLSSTQSPDIRQHVGEQRCRRHTPGDSDAECAFGTAAHWVQQPAAASAVPERGRSPHALRRRCCRRCMSCSVSRARASSCCRRWSALRKVLLCVCVCMCVFVFVCVCVCVCVYVHTHSHTHVHTRTHARTHARTHTQTLSLSHTHGGQTVGTRAAASTRPPPHRRSQNPRLPFRRGERRGSSSAPSSGRARA